MIVTDEQRDRLQRSQEFQDLKGHPGYVKFVAEVRALLASSWESFLTSDPSTLPGLQAWARGVRDVLALVEDAAMDGKRVIAEQAQADQRAQEAAATRDDYLTQRTQRRAGMGARL